MYMHFIRMFIVLILLNIVELIAAARQQFINPPDSGIAKDFSDNPVWPLGSIQQIRWVTDSKSYNISLWQQDLNLAAAYLGISLFGGFLSSLSSVLPSNANIFGHESEDSSRPSDW